MSQITRCPSCATSFKVVADQLRISEGWVRCGQCKEVFDAAAHLLPAPFPALLPDVSLTDTRPPPAAVVRKVEAVQAWGPDAHNGPAPVRGADLSLDESSGAQVSAVPPGRVPPRVDGESVLNIPAPTVPAFLAASESGSEHDPLAPFVWHTRRSPVPAVVSAINAFSASGESDDGVAASDGAVVTGDRPLTPESPSALSFQVGEMAGPAHSMSAVDEVQSSVAWGPDVEYPPPHSDPWLAQRGYPRLEIPASATSLVASPDHAVTAELDSLPSIVSPPVSSPETSSQVPKKGEAVLALVDDDSPGALLRAKPRKLSDVDWDDDDDEINDAAVEGVSFVVAARRKAFWRRPLVRAVLVVVLLLSVLGLAVQTAVQERDRLAALDVRTRPLLIKLCEVFHCEIAPPRQISDVVIDSSSFNKARGDSYQLTLAMKSKATIPVAMPAVELTLTDAQDQPVLRRVLLPVDMAAPAALAARGEWATSISVIVTTGGARVAGYRLLAFYP